MARRYSCKPNLLPNTFANRGVQLSTVSCVRTYPFAFEKNEESVVEVPSCKLDETADSLNSESRVLLRESPSERGQIVRLTHRPILAVSHSPLRIDASKSEA